MKTSDIKIAKEDLIWYLLHELDEAFLLFQNGIIGDDTNGTELSAGAV